MLKFYGVAPDPAVPEIEPCVLEIRSQIFTIKIYSDIRGVCVGINLAIINISSNTNYDYS